MQAPSEKKNLTVQEPEIPVSSTAAIHPRQWPQSIGMVSDGTLQSSDSEEYMRRHLDGDPTESA